MRQTLDNNAMIIFAKQIHQDDDGYITLSVRMPDGKWKQKHFHGIDKLVEGLAKTYSTKCDIHMSVNSFYCPQRSSTNIRKLNAIYIDIDCHDSHDGSILPPQDLIFNLYMDLFDRGLMPRPTNITVSGRGIHLYWSLKPAPKQVLGFYQAVSKSMCKMIDAWLRTKRFSYSVDFGTSNDVARVMRIPGTFNQKSNTRCQTITTRTKKLYTLSELKEKYGYAKRDEHPKSKIKRKNKSIGDATKLCLSRLQDFETLRDRRIYEPEDSWCRRRLTFLYRHYALLAGYDYDTALVMTQKFNKGFMYPLPLDKLERLSKSAETAYNNGKYYLYKSITLVNELSITQEEMAYMRTLVDDVTRQRRRNEKRRKAFGNRDASGLTEKQRQMKKDRQIIAELDGIGLTQSQIAKQTGFSLSKVARLRAELRSGTAQSKGVDATNRNHCQKDKVRQLTSFIKSTSKIRTPYVFFLTVPLGKLSLYCVSSGWLVFSALFLEDSS